MERTNTSVTLFSEHHLSNAAIQTVRIGNYNVGAYYCRQHTKCGGVAIFVQKPYQFVVLDVSEYCREQDVEVCALRVSPSSLTHLTVLTVYRSPTGDFNIFLQYIDRVLKLISKHPVNIILTGDFNVNLGPKVKKGINLYPY